MNDRINILNKQGMLSAADRKQPLSHGCQYFNFESCVDLSNGVKVTPFGNLRAMDSNVYSQDLASFIVWWTLSVWRDLNGFSGFHSVNFEFNGFELV